MSTYETISVVGLGYIGLPTATAFALRGKRVIGVDASQHVVDTINRGEIHITEPDLDSAVQQVVEAHHFHASTKPMEADAFLIAVPTPFKGEDHEADLRYIEAVAKAIAPVLRTGTLVVLESTAPVGATEQMAAWLASARPDLSFPQNAGEASDIRIAYCPERVLPGQVMRELVENDRVIGGMTPLCSKRAVDLYRIFVAGECVVTNVRTAEMAKLTENSFRDVNIAFANELSMICEKLDIDVWELIALANRHPRVNILQPGAGVGGHCIAVDPWFIVSRTPDEARLIRTAREVNDQKPEWVLSKIRESVGAFLMSNTDMKVDEVILACYGLAFKPDIDDLRESPALDIVKRLCSEHPGPVLAVEPNLEVLPASLQQVTLVPFEEGAAAHIHILLVDHRQFREANAPEGWVIDVKGLWEPEFRKLPV